MSLLSESLSTLLFVGGALLLVAEAVAPGAHFFVLGVALLTAGVVGLFSPVGGAIGILVLAAAVLVTTALTLWGYRRIDIYGGEGSAQTLDSDSLRGKFGRVTERVTQTDGEVKLQDAGFNPYYQARSVDGEIEEGAEVMVVDPGGGNVVTVEVVAGGDEIDRQLENDREQSVTDTEPEREFDPDVESDAA
ncbi:NfeD family protein [Halomicrobium mukohataei]|uniref:NfeD family protein n=1 Tax=Halomicrobium mukohataei TaxID=57705 RepID=A0A847UCV2_9EURY|nr:NfeD family protein [Halomicrobium mukohataei]NLV11295.1 NfeD family protein [Halomicrobium mukohataei]